MVCRPVAEIKVYSSTYKVGWLADILTRKVFVLELDKVYNEEYWDRHVRGK
jgi:hypothetical protein